MYRPMSNGFNTKKHEHSKLQYNALCILYRNVQLGLHTCSYGIVVCGCEKNEACNRYNTTKYKVISLSKINGVAEHTNQRFPSPYANE